MSAPRFFVDLPLAPGARVRLPDAVAHHAFRVLRLSEGSDIVLFNGHGGEHAALLGNAQQADALVQSFTDIEREPPIALTLVQALVATEKLDWIVEKATELGAAQLLLLPTERSVVRLAGERLGRRLQHLRSVARAACEQCGRNRLPQVSAVGSFAEVAELLPAQTSCLILTPESAEAAQLPPSPRAVCVAVGPEGGFTAHELRAAVTAGFSIARLGPRVLRTETAGLAALASLLALHGDFAGARRAAQDE